MSLEGGGEIPRDLAPGGEIPGTPVKTLVRHISKTTQAIRRRNRRIVKHFFELEVQLMSYYILRKFQFRYFDPFQRER